MKYILPITAVIAFLLGSIIDDIMGIRLITEVSFADIVEFMTTLVIVFLIPFTLEKYINNKNDIKNIIFDDFIELSEIANKVRAKIYSKKNVSLEDEDRQDLLFLFGDLSRQTSLIEESLSNFDKNTKNIQDELKNAFSDFKSETTGGELFSTSFIIDRNFQKDFEKYYDNYIKRVRVQQFQLKRI